MRIFPHISMESLHISSCSDHILETSFIRGRSLISELFNQVPLDRQQWVCHLSDQPLISKSRRNDCGSRSVSEMTPNEDIPSFRRMNHGGISILQRWGKKAVPYFLMRCLSSLEVRASLVNHHQRTQMAVLVVLKTLARTVNVGSFLWEMMFQLKLQYFTCKSKVPK